MTREQPGQIGSLSQANRRQEDGERGQMGREFADCTLKIVNMTDFCVVYFTTIIRN